MPQKTILEVNGGVPLTDPRNTYRYVVKNNTDQFISYDDDVKFLVAKQQIRVGKATLAAGSNTITFMLNGVATPMDSTDYVLLVYGINGEITSETVNGFTFNALDGGTLKYIAILNS